MQRDMVILLVLGGLALVTAPLWLWLGLRGERVSSPHEPGWAVWRIGQADYPAHALIDAACAVRVCQASERFGLNAHQTRQLANRGVGSALWGEGPIAGADRLRVARAVQGSLFFPQRTLVQDRCPLPAIEEGQDPETAARAARAELQRILAVLEDPAR